MGFDYSDSEPGTYYDDSDHEGHEQYATPDPITGNDIASDITPGWPQTDAMYGVRDDDAPYILAADDAGQGEGLDEDEAEVLQPLQETDDTVPVTSLGSGELQDTRVASTDDLVGSSDAASGESVVEPMAVEKKVGATTLRVVEHRLVTPASEAVTEPSEPVDLSFLSGAQWGDTDRWWLGDNRGDNIFSWREVGDTTWEMNDSSFAAYGRRSEFEGYSDSTGLSAILGERLAGKEHNVAVDLCGGANGIALQNLISGGVIEQGLVTNYEDHRGRIVPNVDHIDGDLVKPATWQKIIDWQERHAPEGFAAVFHSPGAAMQEWKPEAYRGATHLLLNRTRSDGILWTKVPAALRYDSRPGSPSYSILRSILSRHDVERVLLSRRSSGSYDADKYETPHLLIMKGTRRK